jgi:hypothetical protein
MSEVSYYIVRGLPNADRDYHWHTLTAEQARAFRDQGATIVCRIVDLPDSVGAVVERCCLQDLSAEERAYVIDLLNRR